MLGTDKRQHRYPLGNKIVDYARCVGNINGAAASAILCSLVLGLCGPLTAGCSNSRPREARSEADREALLAPVTDPSVDSPTAISARIDRPLSQEDVLWLIAALSSKPKDLALRAAICLGSSKEPAAASALLLKAHAEYELLDAGVIYWAVSRINHPQVLDMLAEDYRWYGYRTNWAGAVAVRLGQDVGPIDRYGDGSDPVYRWWVHGGREALFARYPDLRALDYPSGPFVHVRRNVPGKD